MDQKPVAEGEENHQGVVPGKPGETVVTDGKGGVIRREAPTRKREPETRGPLEGTQGPEGWQGSWGGAE
jgi:hypothetical protein